MAGGHNLKFHHNFTSYLRFKLVHNTLVDARDVVVDDDDCKYNEPHRKQDAREETPKTRTFVSVICRLTSNDASGAR